MRGSHGATGELFAVVPCPADMRQLSLPGDDPVAAAPAAGGGSGVGCCGDGICDEAEARTTCPEDCRGDEGLDAPVITFGVTFLVPEAIIEPCVYLKKALFYYFSEFARLIVQHRT